MTRTVGSANVDPMWSVVTATNVPQPPSCLDHRDAGLVIAVQKGLFIVSAMKALVNVSVFMRHMGGSVTVVCLDTGASLIVAPAPAMATLRSATPTLDSASPAGTTPLATTARGVSTVTTVTLSWVLETTAAPACALMDPTAVDSSLGPAIRISTRTRCSASVTRDIKVPDVKSAPPVITETHTRWAESADPVSAITTLT